MRETKGFANLVEIKIMANNKEKEAVNNPAHYTAGKYEVIDVLEDWGLDFRLANTVKYIARGPHKGKHFEDLKKAMWYLARYMKVEFPEDYERDHSKIVQSLDRLNKEVANDDVAIIAMSPSEFIKAGQQK